MTRPRRPSVLRPGKPPESERLRDLLNYHATLLADSRRNRAFHRALRARVRPGSSVLDLGAGTGIWAVLAARLGAARVVAVERERLLLPVIERLARENGVADRVSVVAGDARRLRLRGRFDLVVSETVGNQGFDEGIVPLLRRARERFLKKGGVLVPEAVSLLAAPVSAVRGLRPRLLSSRSFLDLALHVPELLPSSRLPCLARGACLLRADLRVAHPPLALESLAARFRLRDGRKLGGFALWVEMDLAPGIRLSTRAATSWWLTVLPAEGAGRGPCTVGLEFSKGKRGTRWRVTVRRRGRTEVREHSPLFAYGSLRARR
jgi:SAM-dependent methyltransferase